jgi:hypothetical protein
MRPAPVGRSLQPILEYIGGALHRVSGDSRARPDCSMRTTIYGVPHAGVVRIHRHLTWCGGNGGESTEMKNRAAIPVGVCPSAHSFPLPPVRRCKAIGGLNRA